MHYLYSLLLLEVFMESVIWLGMSAKYLRYIIDEDFEKEFNMILKCWKTGEI